MEDIFLTESEKVIMKAIWNEGSDISLQDLIEVLKTKFNKDYARTTVVTFLIKLTAKGYVLSYRKGRTAFVRALKSEEEYKDMLLDDMLTFWYGGNPTALQEKLRSNYGR